MAIAPGHHSLLAYVALFSLLSSYGYGFNPKLFSAASRRVLQSGDGWSSARASWYGNPQGAGTDGGACGYQNAVESAPFSSLITAAASSLYNGGKGCGVCYQVKCTSSSVCSGEPVTVVVTDECPGCDSQSLLFDLSGTSFGTMARTGEGEQLRNVGIEQIQYRSVDCNFRGVPVTFRVDPGSNGNYFATAIEFQNGKGLAKVELVDASGARYTMGESWGAVYKVDAPSGLKLPYSISLTGVDGDNVFAKNVIPSNYSPGQTYRSVVNF